MLLHRRFPPDDVSEGESHMELHTTVERRAQRRVRTDGTILVHFLSEGRLHTGQLYDLNSAGLYVATHVELARGTLLILEIELPGGKLSEAIRATVARSRPLPTGCNDHTPKGLGVAFVSTSMAEEQSHLLVAATTLTLDLLGYSNQRVGERPPRQDPSIKQSCSVQTSRKFPAGRVARSDIRN